MERGFTRCDECEGFGFRRCGVCENDKDGMEDFQCHDPYRCPSCSGSGLRPTEKLVEAVALSMQELAPNAPLRWFAMARVALTEVAGWERE